MNSKVIPPRRDKTSKHKTYFVNSNSSYSLGTKPGGDERQDLPPGQKLLVKTATTAKAQTLLLSFSYSSLSIARLFY